MYSSVVWLRHVRRRTRERRTLRGLSGSSSSSSSGSADEARLRLRLSSEWHSSAARPGRTPAAAAPVSTLMGRRSTSERRACGGRSFRPPSFGPEPAASFSSLLIGASVAFTLSAQEEAPERRTVTSTASTRMQSTRETRAAAYPIRARAAGPRADFRCCRTCVCTRVDRSERTAAATPATWASRSDRIGSDGFR